VVGRAELEADSDRLVDGFPVVVWQAQGVVMQLLGLGPSEVAQRLAELAEDHVRSLVEISEAIVDGSCSAS
jgi:hypothetical protein